MIKNRKRIKSSYLDNDSFICINEIIVEVEESYKELLDSAYILYPAKDYEFEWELEPIIDNDNAYLQLTLYRSETPQEKFNRISKEKEVQDKKDKKDKEELELKLRTARLEIMQDNPEFILYNKLKEKFKDIG